MAEMRWQFKDTLNELDLQYPHKKMCYERFKQFQNSLGFCCYTLFQSILSCFVALFMFSALMGLSVWFIVHFVSRNITLVPFLAACGLGLFLHSAPSPTPMICPGTPRPQLLPTAHWEECSY